jgi:hypothetical protein
MDEMPTVVEQECECEEAKKVDNYLAIFHNAESGAIEYITSQTAMTLKKDLEHIAPTQIIMIWKGRQKSIQTKLQLQF